MPPTPKPETFGQRCMRVAFAAGILNDLSPRFRLCLEQIIDGERAKLIAARNGATPAAPEPSGVFDSTAFGDRKAIPPTPYQVAAYSRAYGQANGIANADLDGEAFCDHYAKKDWIVGRVKMKDWQAACRTAIRDGWARPARGSVNSPVRDKTKF